MGEACVVRMRRAEGEGGGTGMVEGRRVVAVSVGRKDVITSAFWVAGRGSVCEEDMLSAGRRRDSADMRWRWWD